MSKDPAFLFYSSDFLTGTVLMTDEQVGKYTRLLCLQHQRGHLSEKNMLKICKTYDEDIFSKFARDTDGFYFNERLEEEVVKRKAYSESRRANREKKNKTYDKHMINICNSYITNMENENEIENEDINDNVIENVIELKKESKLVFPFDSDKFKEAWERWKKFRTEIRKPYRSKMSEQAALRKLSEHPEETAIKMIENSIANQWQGLFEIKDNGNGKSKANGNKKQQHTRELAIAYAKTYGEVLTGRPNGKGLEPDA